MRFFQSFLGNPLDTFLPFFPLFYFLTKSHVALAAFKLYRSLMMGLELLILLSLFGIAGLYHHAQFMGCWQSNPGLHAWLVRTPLSTPHPPWMYLHHSPALAPHLPCFFWDSLSWPKLFSSCSAAEASPEFLILLSIPPTYRDYRHVPPC